MTASIIDESGHRRPPSESPEYPEFRAIEVVPGANGVTTVLLGSNPDQANPSDRMTPELTEFFRLVRYDPAVRGILITGRGRRFSSGGNVAGMREQAGRMGNLADNPFWVARIPVDRSDELAMAVLSVDVPIVAAVNGHAIGAGLGLALWSDITVINEKVKIGDPHVRRGLVAPGAAMFAGLVGMARAKAMLLTGRLLTGAEAAAVGLVDQAVPEADVLRVATEIVEDIVSLPPLAIRWTKKILNNLMKEEFHRTNLTGAALESLTMLSTDHAEAVTAWLDKRDTPPFHGR